MAVVTLGPKDDDQVRAAAKPRRAERFGLEGFAILARRSKRPRTNSSSSWPNFGSKAQPSATTSKSPNRCAAPPRRRRATNPAVSHPLPAKAYEPRSVARRGTAAAR
ncbi:hypothetical protein GCM10023205_29550 [Yinghuangia aomiensis]|uniref:Uncharacterized protein n=1 Tax=Yinghuangia aomiensis TaxID=676205 RepID=A0ABP9H889_9ACTN